MHVKTTLDTIFSGVNGAKARLDALDLILDHLDHPDAQKNVRELIGEISAEIDSAWNAMVGEDSVN